MKFYSKKGLLFFIQVDHLSGEVLGDVIDSFYQAGAKNVQIFSTITKKNRPAHVIMVDATEATAAAIEEVIVEECGSSGWHRIDSCHRHTDVTYMSQPVVIHLKDTSFEFVIKGKQISDDRQLIRPEYDSCVQLRDELKKHQKSISLRRLQSLLSQVFNGDSPFELYL